jgi:hypothetical protein
MISNILASSSTQVLLNGSPGIPIRHRRGLRQGDPLSPMLFVFVMDVLNSLFNLAERRGLLHSLEGANIRSRLSVYADDVVLFVQPFEDFQCVKTILDCFGSATGLVLSGTIIRGTLKTPNSQLVTPISIKLQRPDGYD